MQTRHTFLFRSANTLRTLGTGLYLPPASPLAGAHVLPRSGTRSLGAPRVALATKHWEPVVRHCGDLVSLRHRLLAERGLCVLVGTLLRILLSGPCRRTRCCRRALRTSGRCAGSLRALALAGCAGRGLHSCPPHRHGDLALLPRSGNAALLLLSHVQKLARPLQPCGSEVALAFPQATRHRHSEELLLPLLPAAACGGRGARSSAIQVPPLWPWRR
mmetsp:Transcript_40703/g.86633  ORF Transcript_40703/g.86633 Transcript_40703/m.86633 type:complete len:217 (+) Transcript_40703:742-1392(+)